MHGNNIPDGLLNADEKVLWSQIIEAPKVAIPVMTARPQNKIIKRVFRIIFVLTYALSVYSTVRGFAGNFQKEWIVTGIIFACIGLGVQMLTRSAYGQALQAQSKRPIFQNGCVTASRVIFFNHYDAMKADYAYSDIDKADVDFENGGYALKIMPHTGKPSILVGAADFKQAAKIIN